MNYSLLLITLVLTLAGSMLARAAGPPATTNSLDTLSLDQALELAERQHPELAEAKALIEAADGRAKQAGLFPNPTGIARMESAPISGRTPGEAEYLAGISQPIPLGGRLGKARQAAQFERDRRIHELEARRSALRKRVRSAFAMALYHEKAYQSQREIIAASEKIASTTKDRLEAGDTSRAELARAEMELIRAQVELRRSGAMLETSRVELKAAIGDPGFRVKSLEGTLDAAFEIPTLESLAADLSAHPELASAGAEVRAREAGVKLAKAERIPEVRVEALYRRLENTKENRFDIGVSIPIPLFDRNQGRLREARAEVSAAEARSRTTRNTLSVQLHEAHAQLTAALANSRLLNADVLPRAEIVLRAAEARFAAGDIGLTELLPVRRDWSAVQMSYIESLRDVMQAWADLSPFLKEARSF